MNSSETEQRKLEKVRQKVKNELETVYITSDGRKFIKYEDALYAQSELNSCAEAKLLKEEKNKDIIKLVMDVLKSENWGVYYKTQPMQPLEMQDGNPLYKINQVDDDAVEQAIDRALTEGQSWNHSQTNMNQKKI